MSVIRFLAVAMATAVVGVQAQYTIDPNSVSNVTRGLCGLYSHWILLTQFIAQWCASQESTCPLLCTQLPDGSLTTAANDCDPDTLTYDCVCGNGEIPNAANYSLTLPYFICQQYVTDCVNACSTANTACQAACTQDHPCGATNPTRYNVSSTSTTASATGTGASSTSGGIVYNGPAGQATATAGSAQSSSTQSGAISLVDVGRSYGLSALAGGIFIVFALFL